MTLHQLKVFLTIVKLNGVAQAAKALHISQPSVSGVVQSLQDELGVKLFERLGNKRHLTEEGKRVLQRAEAVLANTEAIKDDLDEVKGLKKGKLSVGSAGIATPLIVQAVHKFQNHFPGVEVSFTIQNTVSLYQKLLDGELDIAIVARPSPSPLILAEHYREEELVFIAPPKHPLTRRRSVSLELLAKEPLVGYHNSHVAEMIAQRFTEAGLTYKPSLPINLQMGTREAVRSAVASGLGISTQTRCHVLGDVKAGRIKILNVPELKLKRTMYIAVHKNRAHLSLVSAFKALLGIHKKN